MPESTRQAFLALKKSREQFSPEEQRRILDAYRDYIGLGKDATFNTNALDKYLESKAQDYHVFKGVKDPGGEDIHKKLSQDSPEAKAVRDQISTALNTQKTLNDTVITNSISNAQFKKLIEDVPEKYRAEQILGAMKSIIDESASAIKSQQKHELEAIGELFKNSEFTTQLKTTLNLPPEANLDSVKKNMEANLKTTHQNLLTEFNKSSAAALNTLHTAAAKEMNRSLYLANLNEHNEKMRALFRDMNNKNQEINPDKKPVSVALGDKSDTGKTLDPTKAWISGLDIKDLKVIQTITGKTIKQEDGKFSIDFKMKITDPGYYLDPRNNVQSDLNHLAVAIKACEHEAITMNVNFSNEKVAQERAKQSYRACIEAGFDPKKITIKVNGEVKKPEDIFKNNPNEYNYYHKKSVDIKEKLSKMNNQPVSAADYKSVKDGLLAICKNNPEQNNPEENAATKIEDEAPLIHSTPS